MENLTHSRQPNRAGSTLAAKNPCNNGGGGGFVPATKSLYDDVYGGPPKFGMAATLSPRAEDYSEIFESFHASRASSIPVLDLPAVDEAEAEVFFDVQSSGFDYSEVFGGGFDGLDCAASFEDLLYDGSNGRNVHSSSSEEEAWTPAGSGSLSEESDHFEKNHCLSNEDCYQSFDGDVEFNISYHKANLASNEDMSSRTRHMSELHADPGFAFAYDENDPLQKIEDDIPFLQVTDDDNLNMDFSVGMKKGKHLKKTISQPLNGIVDEQAFEYNLKPDKVYRRSGSLPNGFVTVSDISLRTQPSQLPPPSRPPPGADVTKGGSSRLIPNGKSVASEGTADDSSPPFFDVEVDASSSAAASAAAMKEAMVKAQAKLRSAKEFMDRKKESFQGSSKTGSKNHNVEKVEKTSKIVDECDSLRDEGLQSSCDREDNGMKFSVREEKQKVMTAQEVLDSVGEKLLKVAKESAEKRLGKKSRSSLGSAKIDGGSEWKEESQFFELVRTDKSDKALEQTNHVQISVHNTKILERGQKEKTAVMGVFDQQEENNRKMKSARGNHELEFEKKSKVAHEAFEGEENNGRSKAAKEAHRQKGHAKKEKVAQEVSKQVENVKKVRIAQKPLETEKKSTGVDVLENCNNLVEVLLKDYSFEVEQAMKHKENNGQKLKDSNKQRESEKRLKESCEREDDEKRRSEFFGWEENEEVLKEDLLRAEDEKRLKESHEQKESEKRLKEEVIEWDENEKKQKEACKRQEDEKRFIEALEQEEDKKRLQKVLEQEEHEKRLKETLEWKEDEMKLKEFHKGEENEKRLEAALQWEESGKKQEACEREENEKRLRDACEKEDEKILYGASEQVANSDKLKGAQERREPGRRSKEGFEQEESKKESKEASTWEETENRLKDAGRKEEQKGLNKAHEQTMGDNNGKVQKLAKGDCVRMEGEDLGVSDVAQKLENNDNAQAPKLACTNDKNSRKLEETQESLAHEENGKTKSEPKDKEKDSKTVKTANVLVGENLNQFRTEDAKKSPHLDDGVRKAGEPGIGVGQMHIFKSKSLSQLDSDPINKERKFAHEWGERGNNIKQTHAVSNQEESKDRFVSTHVMKDGVENGRKLEAQPAMMEIKGNIQKPAMRVNASQTTERKEKNLNETLTSEDIETERMKREREMEMERLRKIEEEIEREREREKDRMAVDRATLEARERAYTEARDRAERAAVERAMAEARERLEKACAEARDKTFTEKATMEAKLRAERAAKARERAAEKAMADKAAFETRERIDRSVSDKFLDSFRNSGMKQSSSVVYGGVEVETAQRCKARLERHQRTTERAAKALAEKNMRDLLAQREQTERNRLAETLDADVRRWSSGKEGNLRALLSTLQYILGPDSGWQPIPLTEVITSAAVKKAYRKATLCVHPDKLQQRGASIQQKYICEKVFDLLKEAWNKFNSEER